MQPVLDCILIVSAHIVKYQINEHKCKQLPFNYWCILVLSLNATDEATSY
jgi:hypothetical protein